MKKIAIYGAGGLGQEVSTLLSRVSYCLTNQIEFIGFFDDGKRIGENISHFGKCLGGIRELNDWTEPLDVILAFGNPRTLELVRNKITNPLIRFPNIIEKSNFISDLESFEIGEGNIITGRCCFSVNTKIGSFNLFNGFISCGHDMVLGDFNVIMPGARISGEVKMENKNLIGADSFILQGLKIGNEVNLSPLSALLTKPKDGVTYIGNPAKKFRY